MYFFLIWRGLTLVSVLLEFLISLSFKIELRGKVLSACFDKITVDVHICCLAEKEGGWYLGKKGIPSPPPVTLMRSYSTSLPLVTGGFIRAKGSTWTGHVHFGRPFLCV